MKTRVLSFVDRLAERGVVDRWGFLLFAFGGAAAILVAKSTGLSAVLTSACAASTIILYAVLVQRSGTGRLRGDQAGDNCYYLGLIYTLASLAFAIFTFDPASASATIIQGFGVALATTVVGLVLRVYFSQSRVDLVEAEDTARLELAEAAGRLKAELSRVTVSMNDFGRQTRQSLEEFREEILQSVRQTSGAASESLKEAAARGTEALTAEAGEAATRTKRVTGATDKMVTALEKHAVRLEEIGEASGGIASGLGALERAAEATRSTVEQLSTEIAVLHTLERSLETAGKDLGEAIAAMAGNVRTFDETTSRVDQLITTRLEEVRAVPQEIAANTQRSVEAAFERLRESLDSLAAAQGKIATELAQKAGDSVAIAGRHNTALESELSRSRENVAKVHTALVDMTGKLADRIEGHTA